MTLRLLALLAAFIRTLSQVEPAQAPRRVTFVSVNDVYKLVSLPNELSYFYLNADLAYVQNVTAASCDGKSCDGSDLNRCGSGGLWEACFPMNFGNVQELSMKQAGHDGPRAVNGPCNAGAEGGFSAADWNTSEAGKQTFGGLVDFAATYKWLKDEVSDAGNLAIGTFAGDFIAPSYLAEIFRGKQLVEVMNLMGVDIVDIGNHDVDFGLKTLMGQMEKSAFHYLNSNLAALDGSEIQQPMVKAKTVDGNDFTHSASEWRQLDSNKSFGSGWAVLNKAGVKVCVLGTTDVDKMNWKGKKVSGFQRDIPAAVAIMKQWEAQQVGCTLRIAMTHTRTGNDLNLFRAVEAAGLHLDAIIAGHDHYAAFAELKRSDGGATYVVKAGADARIVSKLSFDISGKRPIGTLELVPVVAGSCQGVSRMDLRRQAFFEKATDLFKRYASKADEANQIPLHVLYKGVYDTSTVRDGESRAVNMWLDLMRQSVSADVLFFQAGLIRQDMFQNFGGGAAPGMELSKLFMLEEFPWGDEDADARSSLFPFKVSIHDLVMTTVPFLAQKYWCNAPFNDANRIHVSGLIVEMKSFKGCEGRGLQDLVKSIIFVGDCHQTGSLRHVSSGCCTSPLCGKLWTAGAWDERMSEKMRKQELHVVTGQFCVPSKYGSHGKGFHEVGMLCRGAEKPENWGSGTEFSKRFTGDGVIEPSEAHVRYASPDFQKHGYFFKQAMSGLLEGRSASLVIGDQRVEDCKQAQEIYVSPSFFEHCACEMDAQDGGNCRKPRRSNPFPRFSAEAVPPSPHSEL